MVNHAIVAEMDCFNSNWQASSNRSRIPRRWDACFNRLIPKPVNDNDKDKTILLRFGVANGTHCIVKCSLKLKKCGGV